VTADHVKSRRLFWRIFLHGVLLIAALTVTSMVVFFHLREDTRWDSWITRLTSIVAKEIEPGESEQKKLKSKLDELAYLERSNLAVYSFERRHKGHHEGRHRDRLLVSAGESRLPPLDEEEIPKLEKEKVLHHARGANIAALVNTPTSDTYLLISWNDARGPTTFVITLILALVVVALMSIPPARAIARPLEKLTTTARKIGQGDLSARSGIVRKDEFGVLARTMDEMAEQLSQRIRSEKELLANVSHEIRTPLSRINVALELCSEAGATEDEIKKYLDGIAGDLGELDRLLEDVLIAARLDLTAAEDGTGKFVLRLESKELGHVVSESEERFSRLHPSRSVKVNIDKGLPEIVVDPALFRRVFDNLLDNAVKYSPQASEIEIEAGSDGDKVVIEVRDRGDGIPTENLNSVFDPFFRTDRSRSRTAGGTGLGLTLCRRIVEAHGGLIEALSRQGGGTTIRIKLG
jgi:signal transduction histidine kinase